MAVFDIALGLIDRVVGTPAGMVAEQPPAVTQQKAERMYAAAKQSRLAADWVTHDTSADSELHSSLTQLRGISRALCRDNGHASRARNIVVNNVIGCGIGLQSGVTNQRGRLLKPVNDAIETAWDEWCDAEICHVGGKLHFADLERLAMGEIFEAGEILIRLHRRAFGNGTIPLGLEVIEAERLAADYSVPSYAATGNRVKMGIEVDTFDRPVAYWIREAHPNEYRQDLAATYRFERVPAADIIHLCPITRWPQTRGEPWMHAAIRKLQDTGGYSEAVIVKARAAACIMGFVESPEAPTPDEITEDGRHIRDLEAGVVEHLAPGEHFNGFAPNANDAGMEPFMRVLIREVAAGLNVSYESLSRDYSQSNYSSSRLSLLEDRDAWRAIQLWFIRSLRIRLHRVWLEAAVMAGAIPGISATEYALRRSRFRTVAFKPRGWSWIDPTKEVEAYATAVDRGFMSISDVIALTGDGRDLEDVINAVKRDRQLYEDAGLPYPEAKPTATPSPINSTPPSGGNP